MPERWERELKKIGDLQPNEGRVRSRTAEGPSGARLRAGRERLLAGIVGVAVFAAAIAFSWDALVSTRPAGDAVGGGAVPEGPALTIVANAQPGQEHAPEAQARYGEVEATIPVQGGDGWDIGNAFPAAMFGPHEAAIPVGAPVVFESNAEIVEVGFNQSNPDGDPVPQELSPAGMATLPSEPGELQIQLSATWPEGRAEFSVFVHLYEPVDALDVDCRAYRVPVWQTRVVRAHPDGIHATFQTDAPREVLIDAPGFTSEPITTLEPGSSTLEIPVPPGIATIACNNAPPSQFTVVDPDGLWVPSELQCPAEDAGAIVYAEEADERLIDEVAIARRLLELRDTDEIVPPFYPGTLRAQMLPATVMVRRGGQVVGKLHVWLGKPARIEGEVCSSSGIHARTMSDASPEPDISPSPETAVGGEEATAAPALMVRCTENGAEVLTPVVRTQVDGVHIVSVDPPAYWEIGLFPVSEPGHSYWAESDQDDHEFARPVPPGEVGVACIDHETITTAELERLGAEATPFLLTDPDGFFTPYAPECAASEQVEAGAHAEGVDPADAAERIRTALTGVEASDVVEMAGYRVEWGSRYWWRIMRDGRIVAALIVGDQSRGVIHGWACRSSGIEGDPSWPGP
jgi:hypothetical protein